ncbi:hypothetical protein C0Q70_18107 [Pomacea canaliculata]|uniref:Uncharacterized protein n=1 Tax=Pomacea canaliculata TaxID=400727 RepID=A0A2T7NMA9_POMCA|nr:hypothetical protein C0Q70_18107 [Pomacea canaliculata]
MVDLEKKVTGYVDTLPLFRDVFPGLPSYRQITLYQHLFRESYAAHVGMNDVTSLKRILDLPSVTPEVVYRHSFDLEYIREDQPYSLEATAESCKNPCVLVNGKVLICSMLLCIVSQPNETWADKP